LVGCYVCYIVTLLLPVYVVGCCWLFVYWLLLLHFTFRLRLVTLVTLLVGWLVVCCYTFGYCLRYVLRYVDLHIGCLFYTLLFVILRCWLVVWLFIVVRLVVIVVVVYILFVVCCCIWFYVFTLLLPLLLVTFTLVTFTLVVAFTLFVVVRLRFTLWLILVCWLRLPFCCLRLIYAFVALFTFGCVTLLFVHYTFVVDVYIYGFTLHLFGCLGCLLHLRLRLRWLLLR